MYRTSKDRRFRKNKKDIQQAYLDLTIEKGYKNFSITDLAKSADINRMTFYAHYETLDDVFEEFVDDMKKEILTMANTHEFSLSSFFKDLNKLMYRQLDFFTYAAKEGHCADFREAFRQAIKEVIDVNVPLADDYQIIAHDLYATCIAYAYLDYLSGDYGKISLEEVIQVIEKLIHRSLVSDHDVI